MLTRLIEKKRLTAFLFVIFLMLFSAANAKKEFPMLGQALKEWREGSGNFGKLAEEADSVIEENVLGKRTLTDFYGYIQLLLDKEEESDFEVVKDTEGKLHYTYFADGTGDTSKLADRVAVLAGELKEEGCELLYVMPPDKFLVGHTQFSRGLPYHMANETADEFLDRLEKEGVRVLDLRDDLAESGLEMSEVFYNTDHHWRIETAFWAASKFCDGMGETYGEKMDPDGYYKDPEHYNFVTYKDVYLGSMGRKTGRFYAEVDDFTLIFPKFNTNYRYENLTSDWEFTGRFEEALVASSVLWESWNAYETDLYSAYLYGNPGFSHIGNMDNPDGIRICMIKDSFAMPFASFVSLRCGSVDLIDPRAFEGDYAETLAEGEYDYVVLMYSPQNLTDAFFPFGME